MTRGVVVAEGIGSPIAPAELAWALIMAATRRIPHYVAHLKHGAWQQAGLKSASMPANFGLGSVLNGKTVNHGSVTEAYAENAIRITKQIEMEQKQCGLTP